MRSRSATLYTGVILSTFQHIMSDLGGQAKFDAHNEQGQFQHTCSIASNEPSASKMVPVCQFLILYCMSTEYRVDFRPIYLRFPWWVEGVEVVALRTRLGNRVVVHSSCL